MVVAFQMLFPPIKRDGHCRDSKAGLCIWRLLLLTIIINPIIRKLLEDFWTNVGNPGCHKPTIWRWLVPIKMVMLGIRGWFINLSLPLYLRSIVTIVIIVIHFSYRRVSSRDVAEDNGLSRTIPRLLCVAGNPGIVPASCHLVSIVSAKNIGKWWKGPRGCAAWGQFQISEHLWARVS